VKNPKFSFETPLIYLITSGEATTENFSTKTAKILNLIKAAVKSKINLIQIREKKLPAKLVFKLVSVVAKITANTSTILLVNDRADVAFAAGADGVHLTSVSLPANIIRRNFPPEFIIGVSAHSTRDCEIAKQQGADLATFSPIYKTPSKENYGKPQGLEKLRAACERVKPFPIIALGGIDETNYAQTLVAGASGFAAIRFLSDEAKLKKLAADLRR
jgi:thiamine-phosphate pyrophosphorylase